MRGLLYEVYSYAIGLPGEAFDELINKLQLVPEGDWTGTYIWSPALVLPIKDLDAAQPVIDTALPDVMRYSSSN